MAGVVLTLAQSIHVGFIVDKHDCVSHWRYIGGGEWMKTLWVGEIWLQQYTRTLHEHYNNSPLTGGLRSYAAEASDLLER